MQFTENLHFHQGHLCSQHDNWTGPSQPQTSRGPRAVKAICLVSGVGHYLIRCKGMKV